MKELMFVWLVTWVAFGSTLTDCEQKVDPYTGRYPTVTTTVACWEPFENHMHKEFYTKEEAEKFVENAPYQDDNLLFGGTALRNFKIEEIK